MTTPWLDMHRRREELCRMSAGTWELIHEEEGFEDTGFEADAGISDFEGSEIHAHFMTADALHPKGSAA